MAKSIKGTKTEKNLLASFAGEAQARNRYTFFASAAKKKGMNRFQEYFWKPRKMKRSTPRYSSNILKAVKLRSQPLIRPG